MNTHDPHETSYTRILPGGTVERDITEGSIDLLLAKDTLLRVVDPRLDLSANETRGGNRILNTEIEAFIISPTDLDVNGKVGYKALRDGEEVEIGRANRGRFNLGEFVSRRHVSISLDGHTVSITDLNSTNGTFIKPSVPRSATKEQHFPATEEELTPEIARRYIVTAGADSAASERHLDHNDDAWFFDTENMSFGVFDGLGGMPGSALASEIAAEVVEESLRNTPQDIPASLIPMHMSEALHAGHRAIIRRGNGNIQTTATIAKLFVNERGEMHAAIASAGDSRAYILRDGELKMLTLDHGVNIGDADNEREALQETFANVVDLSTLSDDEQAIFARRNVISSALGGDDTFLIAGTTVRIVSGDKLLLTTDGIHDNLTTSEIKYLVDRDAEDTLLTEHLVEAALQRSRDTNHLRAKRDDITAVLVTIAERQ